MFLLPNPFIKFVVKSRTNFLVQYFVCIFSCIQTGITFLGFTCYLYANIAHNTCTFACLQFFYISSCHVDTRLLYMLFVLFKLLLHVQERLLEAGYRKSVSMSTSSFWPSYILGDTLRIVFQNMLLESSDEILECSERVWRLLLQVIYFIRFRMVLVYCGMHSSFFCVFIVIIFFKRLEVCEYILT